MQGPRRHIPVKVWYIFFAWNAFAVAAYSFYQTTQRGKDPDYDKLSMRDKYVRALGYDSDTDVLHIQMAGLKVKKIEEKKLKEAEATAKGNVTT